MIYLDSSAIVKLAHREAGTDALRAWLAKHSGPLAASALARTETARALGRAEPSALPTLRAVLTTFHFVPMTDAILDAAADLPGTTLRSLNAIHLATADEVMPALRWFVAYDKRLADAARDRGFAVVSPA